MFLETSRAYPDTFDGTKHVNAYQVRFEPCLSKSIRYEQTITSSKCDIAKRATTGENFRVMRW